MPFLDVKLSCELTQEKEVALKAAFGEAVSLIPGKSEGSLMIGFSDHCRLWMGGKQEGSIAFVNLMIYGASESQNYKAFSTRVIEILEEELGIDHIYVRFEEVPNWFWN